MKKLIMLSFAMLTLSLAVPMISHAQPDTAVAVSSQIGLPDSAAVVNMLDSLAQAAAHSWADVKVTFIGITATRFWWFVVLVVILEIIVAMIPSLRSPLKVVFDNLAKFTGWYNRKK